MRLVRRTVTVTVVAVAEASPATPADASQERAVEAARPVSRRVTLLVR